MEGDKMSNIPSDEDFARADRLSAERFRNLEKVSKNVTQHFKRLCPLHDIWLFPDRDGFRAYVFFSEDKDIEACKRSGVVQEIEDSFYSELERAGRGSKGAFIVHLDLDSHENVLAKYNGNYMKRLYAG
jgi:hypothetical protein